MSDLRDRMAIARAHDEIAAICTEGRYRWRMSIPAQPDRDSDLILSAGLKAAEQVAAKETQRADRAEDQLRAATSSYSQLADRTADTEATRDRWRQRAEQAEAAVQRVRDLAHQAQHDAEHSWSRMFGGAPFPATLAATAILATLDQPKEAP